MRHEPEDFVIKDWVFDVPRRGQGTLMTGVRGCDLTPKMPLDSVERRLVGFLRWCVMNPADQREVDVKGAFFLSQAPKDSEWKASELGHYPQHWYSHVMHCFEVVGYWHPNPLVAEEAYNIYTKMVRNMHLKVEEFGECNERLLEDRIAAGTVVS